MSDDRTVRALWRAFVAEPTAENALRWAGVEARSRSEIPEPPAIDDQITKYGALLASLSLGSTGRIQGGISHIRGPGMVDVRTITWRDVADMEPGKFGGSGAGTCTLLAAAHALEILGIYRAPWADWVVRAGVVWPGDAKIAAERAREWRNKRLPVYGEACATCRQPGSLHADWCRHERAIAGRP